jgi:hypothetical protein
MPDDSLSSLDFKQMIAIETVEDAEGDEEGTVKCECGKEFMYSVHYEENLRQVNDGLVFRCPRCYAMCLHQVLGLLNKE